MRYWVFNEEQLCRALEAWRRTQSFPADGDELVTNSPDNAAGERVVTAFLMSDAAHGLRGDK